MGTYTMYRGAQVIYQGPNYHPDSEGAYQAGDYCSLEFSNGEAKRWYVWHRELGWVSINPGDISKELKLLFLITS